MPRSPGHRPLAQITKSYSDMDPEQQDTPQSWERRSFLKRSTVLGAGVFLAGGRAAFHPAPAGAAPVLYGDGGFTAMAIIDDSLRLVRHAAAFSESFQSVLRHDVNEEQAGNVALLGGMVPMDVEDAVRLLGRLREDGTDSEEERTTEQKLALVLGWIAHRAARRQIKPLHEAAEPMRPGLHPSEVTLYHDATVLRHRSARREDGNERRVDAVTRLFREMGPRMLIRFHTLIPDYDDAAGWIERLAAWRNEEAHIMRRLAEAYQAPDPEKQRRYVVEPNIYDDGDAVIRVARALQREAEPPMRVDEAVAATTRDQSHYAQAVAAGYRHLQAAHDYVRGASAEQDVRERLRS